jgi:hypothetical protein
MRNTLLNRLAAKNAIIKYCAQVKIKPPFDLVFEKWTICDVAQPNNEFGAHYWESAKGGSKAGLLFINLQVMKNKKMLDEFVAHEVIHIKFPELKHGPQFNKKVKDLMALSKG